MYIYVYIYINGWRRHVIAFLSRCAPSACVNPARKCIEEAKYAKRWLQSPRTARENKVMEDLRPHARLGLRLRRFMFTLRFPTLDFCLKMPGQEERRHVMAFLSRCAPSAASTLPAKARRGCYHPESKKIWCRTPSTRGHPSLRVEKGTRSPSCRGVPRAPASTLPATTTHAHFISVNRKPA